MVTENQIEHVRGADLYCADGDKIGRGGAVHLDDETGRPEWPTGHTGLFGTKESFVPISHAHLGHGRVSFPFRQDLVKIAPTVDPDSGHISPDEEQRLFDHYAVRSSDGEDNVASATGWSAAIPPAR